MSSADYERGWADAREEARRILRPYEAVVAALGPVLDLWACDHLPFLGVDVDPDCPRCRTMGPLREAYAVTTEAQAFMFDDEFGLTMNPCEHPSLLGGICQACGAQS